MNGITPNTAQLDEEIRQKSEALCAEIAKKCSEMFVDEIDDCLDKIDEKVGELKESVDSADRILTSVTEISDTVTRGAAAAEELVSSSKAVKDRMDELCEGITAGISATREMIEQSAASKDEIAGFSRQYTEIISSEIEVLKKSADEWSSRIEAAAQTYSACLDELSRDCSSAKSEIDLQSKSLCDSITESNKSLILLVRQCTEVIGNAQAEYEKLLEDFRRSCESAESSTTGYIEALEKTGEKIDSLCGELEVNKSKLDDIPGIILEQNTRLANAEKNAKIRFIITSALISAGIVLQLILHFI